MSIIQAGNTTTTSLIYRGDTTGNLVFTTGGANTTALTLSNAQNANVTGSISALNTFGFENRIINGDMRIWQRGTSFANVASVYTADRWTSSVSNNMTVSQSTDVPNVQYKYSLSMVPAANATPSEFVIRQFIEQQNIFDFAGQTVTGSAWVKCSKSTIKFRLGTQNATGGSDSTQTISVTAGTWTKITYTFTTVFSSITAWTSTPNDSGAFLDIGFVNSTALTTSDYLYFTGVQLELGSQATSFDFRDISRELLMCQRYYEVQTAGQYNVLGAYNSGGVFYTQGGVFSVSKRTAPTFVGSGTGGWAVTGIALYSASGATTFGASSITTSTYALTQTRVAGNSTPSNGAYYIFEGTTTFAFSAEL